MRATDVRVRAAEADFRDVALDHPLRLAGATVDRFTVATVTVTVEDRAGRTTEGRGASVLSVPWSWPRSAAGWEARDAVLRDLTGAFAAAAIGAGPADPLTLCDELLATPIRAAALVGSGQSGAEPVPELAVALAIGGVDNAIHDAWARAAGRPAAELYTREHLREDLGLRFGPARTSLPVQHVVGVGDPLGDAAEDGVRPLREWIAAEGIGHVKVKLAGRDPGEDARRVAAVHRVLRAAASGGISLSLDPNEGYGEPAAVVTMLDALRADAPEAYAAVAYLEQPTPRDAPPDPEGLREIGRRVPVVIDEGLGGQDSLPGLAEQGWSGLVVKAAKGQSLALKSYAYARANGLFVVLQDLTVVDLALEHSARLAATLDLSWPAFEYNSRQYAPGANAMLARSRPDLVQVKDGHITAGPPRAGLY